jgi:hypothetical protein
MIAAVEHRFGRVDRLSRTIEWLTNPPMGGGLQEGWFSGLLEYAD